MSEDALGHRDGLATQVGGGTVEAGSIRVGDAHVVAVGAGSLTCREGECGRGAASCREAAHTTQG